MPIFEYACGDCGERFEKLVLGSPAPPSCPGCGSGNAGRVPSVFGFVSGGRAVTSAGGGCESCSSRNCAECGG